MSFHNPQLPQGHPKQLFYENLHAARTLTWYSEETEVADIVSYVLKLLGLAPRDLALDTNLGAFTLDDSVFLAAMQSSRGASVSVWALSEAGAARVDRGGQIEHQRMMEELARGTFGGQVAWPVALNHGQPTDSSEWTELYEILNTGDVISLGPWAEHSRNPQTADVDLDRAGLTRAAVETLLQHDSDVLSVQRVEGAKAMWRVRAAVDDGPEVEMIVDNGINDIYCQLLTAIDSDRVVDALQAVMPYGVVGLTHANDAFYLRAGFYMQFSNSFALSNSLRALVMARNSIDQGGSPS